jgi:hypothetical protein
MALVCLTNAFRKNALPAASPSKVVKRGKVKQTVSIE